MLSRTTKVIAATTLICGVAVFIFLGAVVSLFVEIGDFHDDVLSDMLEFNAVADQSWTTILIISPAAATREKRATGAKNGCACSAQSNSCPRGPIGPRGRPGNRGHDGPPGIPGPDAYGVAGMIVMSTGKRACIKCAPGPPGIKGRDGMQGERGADGEDGRPGMAGRNGLIGARGVFGDAGVRGSDGEDGPRGYPGRDGVTGRGAPGGPGRIGGRGNFGKQGRRGAIGAPGIPGSIMGPQGEAGTDGQNGDDGEPGAAGHIGAPGENGEYCKCPKKKDAETNGQVVKNDRGYEVPEATGQKLVEVSAIKMEALGAPRASSTAHKDRVVIASAQSDSREWLSAGAPAVEPTAEAYGQLIETALATKEPTPESSSSFEEDVTTDYTTVGYEQPVEATSTSSGGAPSTTTAPPGFAPPRFPAIENADSSSVSREQQGYESAPASATNEKEQPIVQVTPIYHRATGGGRATSTTTTAPIAPVTPVKFVRHIGGWSRRAAAQRAKVFPGSKTHDADLHVQKKASGGARAV